MNKRNCWLAIDKPVGYTCGKVLAKIKKILNTKKIGHTGTLDPFASGVLCVAVGEATKTIPFISDSFTKTYECVIKFGQKTDTLDSDGKIIDSNDKRPNRKDLENILEKFRGEVEQIPPKYSALKVNGKRAYDLARKGEEFELKSRKIKIHKLELLEFDRETAKLVVECSKGTYIRSLGEDIAAELGCLSHLIYLRRTKDLCFSEDNIIKLDFLDKMVHNAPGNLGEEQSEPKVFYPVDYVLDDILAVPLDKQQLADIKQGRVIEITKNCSSRVRARYQSKLVAVGWLNENKLQPNRVFNY
ncbi:MAG: tRNA pseudouridine(55) synthase TruB [Rickettsiales bacterium]